MFGCPEFCPEFALCLLVTVALAREIVSCIKVVHVQYVLFGCRTNVVWWVTIAREWMGHEDVIWTCGAVITRFQVVTGLEGEALGVVCGQVLDPVHGEEVALFQVQAVLLAAELVIRIKVKHIDNIAYGDWANAWTKLATIGRVLPKGPFN